MARYEDEFDRANRPPLMEGSKQRVAELRGDTDDAPAPRQTNPIAGPRRAPGWVVPVFALLGLGAFVPLFSLAPRTPLATPASAPTAVTYESLWAPTEAPAAPATASEPVAPPTAVPAPAEAPAQGIGTGEGVIEPVQAAPAGVGSPPPPQLVNPTAEPVISDLVAIPADTGLGVREKPCTHPSCEGSQP